MNIIPYSDETDDYLKSDAVIDYEDESITQLADTLQKANIPILMKRFRETKSVQNKN